MEPRRTTETPEDDLPDTALFWRWVGKATRPVVGWVLYGVGGLCLLIGWFGISRESIVAKQIPYLISGGIGGLALVVVGAVFLGTEDLRRDSGRLDRLEKMVNELHAVLLVRAGIDPEEVAAGAGSSNGQGQGPVDLADTRVVALPSGKTYHRPDCPMIQGKQRASAVTVGAVRNRKLEPCKMCEPSLSET